MGEALMAGKLVPVLVAAVVALVVSVAVGLGTPQARGQDTTAWEYAVIDWTGSLRCPGDCASLTAALEDDGYASLGPALSGQEFVGILDAVGAAGWELVQMGERTEYQDDVILKRPKR